MNTKLKPLYVALPLLLIAVAAAAMLWPGEAESTSVEPGAQQSSPQPAAAAVAQQPAPVQTVALLSQTAEVISFDDLEFEIEPGQPFEAEMLTEEIEALDGQLIKIRGYMLPTYRADGIEEFVLVRDDQICCFGPTAKVCHNMQVYMTGGATARYTTRTIEVEGRFSLQNWVSEDGVVYSCYRIDATRAE